jgi:hypothetical protein
LANDTIPHFRRLQAQGVSAGGRPRVLDAGASYHLSSRPPTLALPIGDLRQGLVGGPGFATAEGARRRLLMLGIAWKWQAAVHGGLPRPLERRLAAVGAGPQGSGVNNGAGAARSARPRLMPGTRLIRVWKGERHTVEVTETSYLWRGQRWTSLSAVAGAITGSRRNGPAFFGLRERKAA